MIYFVHAIALHIQADAVVAVLARQLNKAIYAFALADGGRDEGDDGSDPGRSEEAAEKVRRQGDALLARRSGYVQTIDYEAVVALADESSCEIAFNAGPGDFVIAGAPLASVSGRKVDDELRDAICAQVGLGPHRTAAQRIDFELRALVEVALRALSPSLNDPYTALACVHHLAEAIALLMRRRASSPVHTGKPDGGMVYEKRRSFEEIVDMVFRPLLDASATSIIALKGIEGVLSTLHSIAATDDEKRVLDVHFEHVRHCLGVLDSARSD